MLQLSRRSCWESPLKYVKSQSKLLLAFCTTTTTTAGRNDPNPSRPSPPPIRVSLTESAGRGVFATRAIGAGELIHTAKPIVSHPSLSTATSICFLCLRSLRHRRTTTSEGQSVSFCSQECEEQCKVFYEVEKHADWSAYNNYCCTQGLKYPLLVKRLACMVISGVATADSLGILQPSILAPEMILQMEKEFVLLRSALEEACIPDEHMAFLTKQWYVGVLARIRINAFRIELAGGSYEDLLSSAAALVEAEAAVGNAVYMLPSFYNHDCDPNTHIVWIENSDARVKSLRDIEAVRDKESTFQRVYPGDDVIKLLQHMCLDNIATLNRQILENAAKSCGSAILMLVWTMMLAKPSFPEGLDSNAVALGVCQVIDEFLS